MKFFKKLVEEVKSQENLTEEWHDVEGVTATVGNYLISAIGYFDETELYVNVTNTETGQQFKAEVYKNGNQFDINMWELNGRKTRPVHDTEQEEFLTKLVQGFLHNNYDKILTPPDSDDYDNYYNRRERMRQARDYRSELELDDY
jgi:hypothetical protein